MKHNKFKSIIPYTAVLLILLWGLTVFAGGRKDYVAYSTVAACFQQERVVRFTVSDSGVLSMELKDGATCRHALADVDAFRREMGPLFEDQYQRGVLKYYDFEQRYEMPLWLVVLLPCVASAVLVRMEAGG